MALSFDINANTRNAESNLKKLGTSLGDVSDSLDDVARDGDTAGRKLEDSFRDMARKAKDAGDDAGRGLKTGVKSGLDDAKSEAGQSGREAAASFGGGFEDVGDFVQETLANAFAGLGPVGATLGIAAAALVGTLLTSAQQAQEKLAETRESAADLASQLYENGGTLPLTDRVDELFQLLAKERKARNPFENLTDGFLDLGTNIDMAKTAAKAADVPLSKLIRGLTGADIGETKDLLKGVNDELERMDEESGNVNLDGFAARQGALQGIRTELESVITRTELANELYTSSDFLSTQRVDDLTTAWENARTAVSDYFTEGEDGALTFDVAGYVAAWEDEVAKLDEIKTDLVTLPDSIREEAIRQFGEGGAGAADAYIDAYQAADADTKLKLVEIAKQQGDAAGKKQGEELAAAAESAAQAKAQGMAVIPIKYRADLDTSAIDNWSPPMKRGQVSYYASQSAQTMANFRTQE